MALARSRRNETGFNYWPGFVDALSTLVLSIVFLLSVFLVVQFFLSQEVTGKDKALEQLNAKLAQLAAILELSRRSLGAEMRTRSALTSPQAVRDYLRLALGGREHEVFVAIFLDAQHRVISVEELFRGTLTQTSVYPREIVKAALKANAAAAIFAHNHPSGVAEPSQADELLTRQLKESLAMVDVKVLDHFIVAGRATLSFAERGLL